MNIFLKYSSYFSSVFLSLINKPTHKIPSSYNYLWFLDPIIDSLCYSFLAYILFLCLYTLTQSQYTSKFCLYTLTQSQYTSMNVREKKFITCLSQVSVHLNLSR